MYRECFKLMDIDKVGKDLVLLLRKNIHYKSVMVICKMYKIIQFLVFRTTFRFV
jgi:hypothetical protein